MSTFSFRLSIKFVIEKAVKQILHVYPHFETEILEFSNLSE